MPVVNVRRYTGVHDITLVVPQRLGQSRMKVLAVLPKGSQLRIERLLEDNGSWGGVMVWATVEGTNSLKNVILDDLMLAKNRFINTGASSSSSDWGVNPKFLEKPPE